jgi:hypothetical protein
MCIPAGIVGSERFKQEVIMPAISEKAAAQEPAVNAAMHWADASRQAVHFLFGAQRMIFGEMVFAAEAMLDRTRTEIHLSGEFAAKFASAHSVQDWNAMCGVCSQHQLEFVRRDYDRLLRHSERLIEATSNLLNNQQ